MRHGGGGSTQSLTCECQAKYKVDADGGHTLQIPSAKLKESCIPGDWKELKACSECSWSEPMFFLTPFLL